MSFSIILNSSNVSNKNNNTQFLYNFVGAGIKVDDGDEMCISSIIIPYSWFNITTNYNNNSFQYIIQLATLNVTFTVTIPNGFYQTSDIQNYLQSYMISNNFYKTNTTTNLNFYYISIITNINSYGNQIICYPVESSAQAGWTYPSGFPYSTSAWAPQVVISSTNNFGSILGFTAGNYPPAKQTTSYNITSNTIPNATPVNSLVVRCSMVNNNVVIPSDILDSFPINTTFGSNITYQPSYEKWVKMKGGVYSAVTLSIVDNNFLTVYANDINCLITILIKKKESKYFI